MTTEPAPTPTPFITFYSFKGGVGRSLALMNVAGILAGRGLRVLVLDMDLEAPGVSFVVRGDEPGPGFVELMTDARDLGLEGDFFSMTPEEIVARYTRPYPIPEALRVADDGVLHVLPAGRLDAGYQGRLDRLDLAGLYRDGRGRPLLLEYKYTLQHCGLFDLVLIDSRTGFSDESGICTRDLADHVFVVMGLNGQNVQGTAAFLRALRKVKADASMRVVLSPVPNGEDDLVDARVEEASAVLREAWGADVLLDLQIPYHPRLALTEEPLVFRRARGHLFDAYVRLKDAVLEAIGWSRELVWNAVVMEPRRENENEALLWLERLRFHEPDVWNDPRYSRLLIHWAMRGDADRIREALLRLAPPTWPWWGDLALGLTDMNSLLAETAFERYFKRLVRPTATHTKSRTRYAIYRWRVLNDLHGAERWFNDAEVRDERYYPYTRALHARFRWRALADADGAQRLYESWNQEHPNQDFATFLIECQGKRDEAHRLHERALAEDPDGWDTQAAYACFLIETGELERATSVMASESHGTHGRVVVRPDLVPWAGAKALLGDFAPLIHLTSHAPLRAVLTGEHQTGELDFYAYVHLPEARADALRQLRLDLPGYGVPPCRRLKAHVNAARTAGHPSPDLVTALAAVLDGEQHFSTLDVFPEWVAAGADRPAEPA